MYILHLSDIHYRREFGKEFRNANGDGYQNMLSAMQNPTVFLDECLDRVAGDRETVDLRYVEQLADSEQTSALAYLTRYALEQLTDGRKNLRQIAAELRKRIETKGWDGLTGSYVPCGLAKPRIQEIFAALNRYRG